MLSKHMYSKCAHFKPVAVELKCKWMKKHSLPAKVRVVVSGVLLSPGEMKGTSNYAHCRAWSETSGATLHRDHGNTSVPTGQAGAGAGAH